MNDFQPLKLQVARKRLGWSMDELVAQMGSNAVSKMSISKFERGVLKPSLATANALAKACDVDVSYFYKTDISIGQMHYRYKNDKKTGLSAEVEAQVKYEVERRCSAEMFMPKLTPFVNPVKCITLRTYDDSEKAASQLRRIWEIGTQPIHSVYELLEEHGVRVVEIEIPCTDLLGLSMMVNDCIPIVVINTTVNTTSERKRFTALHELAHLLFNIEPVSEDEFAMQTHIYIKVEVSQKCPTVERLCHRFAGAMLISQQSIMRRLGDIRANLSLEELISIRNMYGISIAATIHRAHDIAAIPDSTYNHLYDTIIKTNIMETGMGFYPIMETADRTMLIEKMVKMETKK